jgi:hypothetical protein
LQASKAESRFTGPEFLAEQPRGLLGLSFSPLHYGEEIRESAQAKADRLVSEELKHLGWEPEELGRRRKGAPEKQKIALRLRREAMRTMEP